MAQPGRRSSPRSRGRAEARAPREDLEAVRHLHHRCRGADRARRARLQVLGKPPHRRRADGGRALRGRADAGQRQARTAARRRNSRRSPPTAPAAIATLARLQLAGALLKAGQEGRGARRLRGARQDSRRRSAAARASPRLQAAACALGEADFTEMQNWLTPLMADDSPWRYSARELLGTGGVQGRQVGRGAHDPDAAACRPEDAAEHRRAGADRDGGDRRGRDCQEGSRQRRAGARRRQRTAAECTPAGAAPPATRRSRGDA